MQTTEIAILNEADLLGLAIAGLRALGVEQAAAEGAARILVLADMMRIHTHGTARVLSYGERLEIGGIDPKAEFEVTSPAPAVRQIDGRNGLGPAIGARALDEAMEAARACGVGIAFVRGSNHFGPIAPYAYLAAQQGFATMIASNATTTIAPSGGREARLGNNPLGFGYPNPGGDPIILDMAMSVVARAKIRAAQKAGQPIPESWATDAEGLPTTDPSAALKGFLQPVGGYKGYGLSLAVDLMTGLLSGAAYLTHVKSWVDEPEAAQNLGHVFLLIDTKILMPTETLAEKMTDFGDILHSTPRAQADVPILLPGEREMRALNDARSNGIALEAQLVADLRKLAG